MCVRFVYLSILISLFDMLLLMLMLGVGLEIYCGFVIVIVGGMVISVLFILILMLSLL